MGIGKKFCFQHPSGEDIYLFTLRNRKGTQVLISNYGAIITSFKIKMEEDIYNDIVLGFDRMEEYFNEPYQKQYAWFGSAVGRYANRVKNAVIEIDGNRYPLSKNNGNDQLHGGRDGFDRKVWNPVSMTETPFPALELTYKSTDGEEGYPGNLEVMIRFCLNDDDELSYEYHAHCDKPTAINLTHHSYFNLDNGTGTIAEHLIKIAASSIMEQDENFVATGKTLPVDGTRHDFTRWKKINKDWLPGEGYDQTFVIDGKGKELSWVAGARSQQSGIRLEVWSTEPVVHFYTGKWIPELKGKNNHAYGPFSGFCLETQVHPNAINLPGFPDTILRPGENYFQKTVYKIFHDPAK